MTGILIQLLILGIVVFVLLKLNELLVENGKWRTAIYYIVVAIAAIAIIKILFSLLIFVPMT